MALLRMPSECCAWLVSRTKKIPTMQAMSNTRMPISGNHADGVQQADMDGGGNDSSTVAADEDVVLDDALVDEPTAREEDEMEHDAAEQVAADMDHEEVIHQVHAEYFDEDDEAIPLPLAALS